MASPKNKNTEAKPAAQKNEPAGSFVDKQEFDSFKEENARAQNGILDALGDIARKLNAPTTEAKPAAVDIASADASNDFLPKNYQLVFEKYFDPADGFEGRLSFPATDEKTGRQSGGITFTISVPLEFSNTDDGYRKMYKVDLRTKALEAHNIVKGIEDWCKLVASNLKYDKNAKRK